jgi:hypothetical protein
MHTEKAPQLVWIQVFLIVITMIVVVIVAVGVANEAPAWPVLVALLAIIAWAFISFFSMKYEIDDEELRAKMWPFNYKVPRDEIESLEIKRIPWWAGFGYHIMGKKRFINSMYGPCLVITKTNGVSLWITPQDPDAFAKLLDKRRR